MKKTIITLMMAISATISMAKDIKTVVFTTMPQMHCENCENKIKGNLRFEKGVKKIETDIEKQHVTVTYDADKTTIEKLQNGFEKFGYEATVVDTESNENSIEADSQEKNN